MYVLITGAAAMLGRKLTGWLAKGGAVHSRPITSADVVATRPPATAAVEVVARDLRSAALAEKFVARGSTRPVRAHAQAGGGIVRRDHPHSYRERTRSIQ
jgi:nucleoside-diphosphate-sugar epimerase